MNTEKFLFEIAADTKKLRAEVESARKDTGKLGKEVLSTQAKFEKFGRKAATGVTLVTAAAVAGATAFTAYANAQGRAIRETEVLANMAGLGTEEFKKLSFIMGTAGVTGEKFGEQMKDTQEKVGDFLNSGGGGFQDFADAMRYTTEEATELALEFQHMSGDQVLQAMVNRMQAAGKTTQEMSHALEGMASDTTRLIPLLMDGGAAAQDLGETFDKINIPLSDDEKQQFVDLANNVDLAQDSFVNFLNNAISPFLPAVNEAAVALTEFFSIASNNQDLSRIVDNNELINGINSLNQLNILQKEATKQAEDYASAIAKWSKFGRDNTKIQADLDQLEKTKVKIQNRTDAIKAENAENKKALDLEAARGNLTSEKGKSGADEIKLEEQLLKDLQVRENAQKSEVKLLLDEKNVRLAIVEGMFDDENKLTADKLKEKNNIKAKIEADYIAKARELAITDEQNKLDAITSEQKSLEEKLNHKLISEQEYQEKLKEIIGVYAPETLDPSILEEKNQIELDALNEKLENQLISHEDYFVKLKDLQDKDSGDKKAKGNLEDSWARSSVKTQLDQGLQLLTAMGTNGKAAHRVKQGLAASNAFMSTKEGVMDALAKQNYGSATLIAATGAVSIAGILASKPDGGGGGSISAPAAPTQQPTESFNDQGANVTDLTGGDISRQVVVFEFSDELVDVVSRHIGKSHRDGRT